MCDREYCLASNLVLSSWASSIYSKETDNMPLWCLLHGVQEWHPAASGHLYASFNPDPFDDWESTSKQINPRNAKPCYERTKCLRRASISLTFHSWTHYKRPYTRSQTPIATPMSIPVRSQSSKATHYPKTPLNQPETQNQSSRPRRPFRNINLQSLLHHEKRSLGPKLARGIHKLEIEVPKQTRTDLVDFQES